MKIVSLSPYPPITPSPHLDLINETLLHKKGIILNESQQFFEG